MQPISPLTYKVLAYQAVPNFNMNDCVDWALDMISLGYDTESLSILVGLDKPVNYFETVHYLEAAIKELGLRTVTGDEGIVMYCNYYITQISKGINVRENLALSCNMLPIEYHSSTYDFCQLHWAWQELEYDGKQWYWDGATLDNIEQIAIDTAKQWLVEHETTLKAIFI